MNKFPDPIKFDDEKSDINYYNNHIIIPNNENLLSNLNQSIDASNQKSINLYPIADQCHVKEKDFFVLKEISKDIPAKISENHSSKILDEQYDNLLIDNKNDRNSPFSKLKEENNIKNRFCYERSDGCFNDEDLCNGDNCCSKNKLLDFSIKKIDIDCEKIENIKNVLNYNVDAQSFWEKEKIKKEIINNFAMNNLLLISKYKILLEELNNSFLKNALFDIIKNKENLRIRNFQFQNQIRDNNNNYKMNKDINPNNLIINDMSFKSSKKEEKNEDFNNFSNPFFLSIFNDKFDLINYNKDNNNTANCKTMVARNWTDNCPNLQMQFLEKNNSDKSCIYPFDKLAEENLSFNINKNLLDNLKNTINYRPNMNYNLNINYLKDFHKLISKFNNSQNIHYLKEDHIHPLLGLHKILKILRNENEKLEDVFIDEFLKK